MASKSLKRVKGNRYYNATAEQYEAVRSKQPWWSVEQREMRALLRELPRDLTVVDIPFGTGRFVPYYLDQGYAVHGLDASKDMVTTAQKILGEQYDKCNVVTGFSTALPFEDNQFDLLVSTRFLRDIILFRDVKKTMEEFARVTKRYAIIQLGYRVEGPFEIPQDDEKMGSRMSMEQTQNFLLSYGFKLIKSIYVKGSADKSSEIHHILCEKV